MPAIFLLVPASVVSFFGFTHAATSHITNYHVQHAVHVKNVATLAVSLTSTLRTHARRPCALQNKLSNLSEVLADGVRPVRLANSRARVATAIGDR